MKILFTGATGVLGRASVPVLVADGHDVTAVSRNRDDLDWLDQVGANPVEVDLFEPASIDRAMAGIDTVVHYATAIPPMDRFSKRESWTLNDRLRWEATGLLVDSAIRHGASKFIQQSITFIYADGGDQWITEESPLDPAWEVLDSALTAEDHVDRFRASGGTGVVLRLARLYGPGRASDQYVAAMKQRKVPDIGAGDNFISSLHVDDAASALRAAMSAPDGVYNVTDDQPVTAEEYSTSLAAAIDAPKPRRLPSWVARLALGKAANMIMASQRVSNKHFRETTGWTPVYRSVHEGWRTFGQTE